MNPERKPFGEIEKALEQYLKGDITEKEYKAIVEMYKFRVE
ncbi:MAG: hypothetical protein V3V26_00180 [Candidatus Aenigmarchaeota archaeon]